MTSTLVRLMTAVAALCATGSILVSQRADAGPAVRTKAVAPMLAITFDDLPAHGALPPGQTRASVLRSIIATLKGAHVPVHGFLNASFGQGDPHAREAIAAWRAAALPTGNHGYHHRNLNDLTPAEFKTELVSNEPAVDAANARRQPRWFRYPFLSEGTDPSLRNAARRILAERGYRVAAVTMSFGDFLYAEPYARCMAKGDDTAVVALERQWLMAARAEALAKRARSMALYGREVPQILLLHVGALDARMLPRTIALYRALGYRFVTLEQAQVDPFYASANDLTLPSSSPTLDGDTKSAGPSFSMTDLCR